MRLIPTDTLDGLIILRCGLHDTQLLESAIMFPILAVVGQNSAPPEPAWNLVLDMRFDGNFLTPLAATAL